MEFAKDEFKLIVPIKSSMFKDENRIETIPYNSKKGGI